MNLTSAVQTDMRTSDVGHVRLQCEHSPKNHQEEKAGTYQHLLQVSCTIWSLSIMHCNRGWSQKEEEIRKTHYITSSHTSLHLRTTVNSINFNTNVSVNNDHKDTFLTL